MADNYNYDMQRLQQDAIRRAREMQSRAQINAPQNIPHNRAAPKPPAPVQTASKPAAAVPAAPQPELPRVNPPSSESPMNPLSSISDIFESLFNDKERALLLLLIVLLVEEKADVALVFALMYLAL